MLKADVPPNSLDYLFLGVALGSAVSEIAGISQALAVSVFGLLEPLRHGTIHPREGNMPVPI